MKKRILSMLLVCLMMATCLVVNADAVDVAISVDTLNKASATVGNNTNLDVYVKIDQFPSDDVAQIKLNIEFDPTQLQFYDVVVGDVVVAPVEEISEDYISNYWPDEDGEATAADVIDGQGYTAVPKTGWVHNKANANSTTHKDSGKLSLVNNTAGYAFSNLYKNDAEKIVGLRFRKATTATGGKVDIKVSANFTSASSAGGYDLDSKVNATYTNGAIILPEAAVKYAVSASANNADYGTVAVDTNQVAKGGKVTVTATPAEGYEVESYTVNGGEAIAANSNTFEVADIKEATTIVVNFKKVVRVTAIKTFVNRLYDNGTLYTGVTISEGDDYAAAPTIKAGINIAKAGTKNGVNYWLMDGKAPVSTGNNTSVYVIGLNNVTDTTDITKASASKGVLVVGETTYYGDPVTAIYGE